MRVEERVKREILKAKSENEIERQINHLCILFTLVFIPRDCMVDCGRVSVVI